MKELIIRAQGGDKLAFEEIIARNEKLVWSIVHRFKGRGVDLQDLFQIGANHIPHFVVGIGIADAIIQILVDHQLALNEGIQAAQTVRDPVDHILNMVKIALLLLPQFEQFAHLLRQSAPLLG